jgi:protein translocase SecG subunit
MVLNIIQIIIAVALVGVILLQVQGSGLSSAFGGGGGEFYRSKQSLEKMLIYATITLSVLFGVVSIILLIPR